MQKKIVRTLLVAIFLGYLGLILWTNRTFFNSQFDAEYWKDRYDHSQWQIPNARRTLGDDGLYLYEGYRLINGDDPTRYNAEVPPLGKYAIGAAVKYLGNGYWFGFITMTLALAGIFLLSFMVLKNILVSALLTLIVALDPLIASQFTLTMMDGLQLLFLVTTLILFIRGLETNRHMSWWLGAAGVSFGLFSEVKFPFFSPFLAVVFLWVLWSHTKNIRGMLIFFLSAICGYLIPYVPYVLTGHTVSSWVSTQKYVISFYLNGSLRPTIGSAITTLVIGRQQDIFSHIWNAVALWTPAWPVIFAGSFAFAIKLIRKPRITPHLLIVGVLGVFLLPYAFMPFWTRYLVVILPFLYLAATLWLRRYHPKAMIVGGAILLLANAMTVTGVLFPTPENTVRQFVSDWKNGLFLDMYDSLTDDWRAHPRAGFHRTGQAAFADAQIEAADISINTSSWSRNQEQTIPLTITYATRNLGTFTQHARLPATRIDGAWRIPWDWDMLIEGFAPDRTLQTTIDYARRGSIVGVGGTKLAWDNPSYMVSITPQLVPVAGENDMLSFLEDIFEHRVAAVSLHSRYAQNNQPDRPVPVGIIMQPLTKDKRAQLQAYRGLTLTPAWGRFTLASQSGSIGTVENTLFEECCSVLYSTTSYDGVNGLEKQLNATLKGVNGGTLTIMDKEGNIIRTLIQKEKKDGRDVVRETE